MDPVAERLASVGDEQAVSVLDWLDGQHERQIMNRRAFLCSFTGWLLVTTAAMVGWAVAASLARDVRAAFGDVVFYYDWGNWDANYLEIPASISALPVVMGVIACSLLVGGMIGWRLNVIPGLRSTRSAIDWAGASDAMTRLLAVGCTYPEAFRAAASISQTSVSRHWLMQAAERVERGAAGTTVNRPDVDTAMLELLVEPSKSEPHHQWRLAAEHFSDVAERRLALLLGAVPMISTILSGFLIWVSISASLGWMWRAAAEMLGGFT